MEKSGDLMQCVHDDECSSCIQNAYCHVITDILVALIQCNVMQIMIFRQPAAYDADMSLVVHRILGAGDARYQLVTSLPLPLYVSVGSITISSSVEVAALRTVVWSKRCRTLNYKSTE